MSGTTHLVNQKSLIPSILGYFRPDTLSESPIMYKTDSREWGQKSTEI